MKRLLQAGNEEARTKKYVANITLAVFCLAFATAVYFTLAQPGITMDNEFDSVCSEHDLICELEELALICGLDELEHEHDEECYVVHEHDDDCYTLHEHTEDCFNVPNTDNTLESEEEQDDEIAAMTFDAFNADPPQCEDLLCANDCWVCKLPCCEYCETELFCELYCGLTCDDIGFCPYEDNCEYDCESEIMCCDDCCGIFTLAGLLTNSNLNNFLDDAKIYDQNNLLLASGAQISKMQTYTLALSFREKPNNQLEYNTDGLLIYTVANGIALSNVGKSYPIPGAGGAEIGTFTILSETQLAVRFDDVYIDGKPALVNFIDLYVNAAFSIKVHFRFDDVDDPIDFGFDIIISVTVGLGKPIVTKTSFAGWYNQTRTENNIAKIDYTVNIRADFGQVIIDTVGNFARSENGDLFWDSGGVVLNEYNSLVVRLDGTVIPSSQYSIVVNASDNQVRDIVFHTPVTIPEDKMMVITYTLEMGNPLRRIYGDPTGHFSLTAENTTYVYYNKNAETGISKIETAEARTPLIRSFLRKTGTRSTAETIRWIITAGEERRILMNGGVVEDTFGQGVYWPDNAEVTVRLYRRTSAELEQTIIFKSSEPAENALLGFEFRDDGFIYTIPTLAVDIYYIEIEFITADGPPELPRRQNFVSLLGGTSSYSVGSNSPIMLSRPKAEFYNDGTIDVIRVTHTLQVSAGNQGTLINLQLRGLIGNSSANNTNSANNNIIKLNGYVSNLNFYTDDPILQNNTRFFVASDEWNMHAYFGAGAAVPADSRWPTNDEATIIFTYDICMSAPFLRDRDGQTLREFLSGATMDTISTVASNFHAVSLVQVNLSSTTTNNNFRLMWPVIYSKPRTDNVILPARIVNGAAVFDLSARWYAAYNITYAQLFGLNLSNVNMGEGVANPGDNAVITVHFDPRLEYAPGTFRVSPTGSTGLTTVPDNLLRICNVTNTVSVNVSDIRKLYATTSDFEIHYSLRLKELAPEDIDTTVYFDNKVVFSNLEGNGSAAYGRLITGEFSNTRRIGWKPEIAEKSVEYDGNIAKFEIKLNSAGLQIGPNDGLLVVEDIMNDSLALNTGSIKVYINGVLQADFPRELEKLEVPRNGYPYYYTLSGANILTFYLPDKVPVRITYTALISGNPGQLVEVINNLTINGRFTPRAVNEKYVLPPGSSWATASRDGFDLYKVDADNRNIFLKGAIFDLYTTIVITGADTFTTSCGRTFYKVPDVTIMTDERGYTRVDSAWLINEGAGADPFANAIYALKETEAPIGYENGGTVYFSFAPQLYIDTEDENKEKPILIEGQSIRQIIDNLFITNISMKRAVNIFGRKITVDNLPETIIPPFQFNLLKVDSHGNPMINQGLDGPAKNQLTVTMNPDTNRFFFNVPDLGIGKHYFIVTEVLGNAPGWIYDDTAYIVEVEIIAKRVSLPSTGSCVEVVACGECNFCMPIDSPLLSIIRYRKLDANDRELLDKDQLRLNNDGKEWKPLDDGDRLPFTNIYGFRMDIEKRWEGVSGANPLNSSTTFTLVSTTNPEKVYTFTNTSGGRFVTYAPPGLYNLFEAAPSGYAPSGDWSALPARRHRYDWVIEIRADSSVRVHGSGGSEVVLLGPLAVNNLPATDEERGDYLPETGGKGRARFTIIGLLIIKFSLLALCVLRKIALKSGS